jgi:hypothetical protein
MADEVEPDATMPSPGTEQLSCQSRTYVACWGCLRAPDPAPRLSPGLRPDRRELARMVPCNPGHISNLRSGKARPSPELAETLDDLATAYPGTPSAVLLDRVRGYLSYVTRLLDAKTTLAGHRRLLVVGGWLSLLAATCRIGRARFTYLRRLRSCPNSQFCLQAFEGILVVAARRSASRPARAVETDRGEP